MNDDLEGDLPDARSPAQACGDRHAMLRDAASSPISSAETKGRRAQNRSLPFLIRRDGTWLYRGTPVRRKAMVCLFSAMIQRDAAGAFWLETPTECGEILVEDAPFVAVELDFRGSCGRRQTLCFRTNVDEVICAGPDHPIEIDWDRPPCDESGPIPYVHVRAGDGDLPILARLTRSVYYELAALAVPGHVEGRPCLGVWSQDCFFPLGRVS